MRKEFGDPLRQLWFSQEPWSGRPDARFWALSLPHFVASDKSVTSQWQDNDTSLHASLGHCENGMQ